MPSLYDSGAAYDRILRTEKGELEFWGARCGLPGSLLELGCGTGRLAIPLALRAALQGQCVTGVDAAPAMLAEARRKAVAAGVEVEWIAADLRTLALARAFARVAFFGSTLAHCTTLDDLAAALTTARRHLSAGGRLLIDLFVPDPRLLAMAEWIEMPFAELDEAGGEPVRLVQTGRYDHATQVRQTSVWRPRPDGGRDLVAEMALRMTFPQELDALLRWQGFVIEERCGAYDGAPFSTDSVRQLVVAKLS